MKRFTIRLPRFSPSALRKSLASMKIPVITHQRRKSRYVYLKRILNRCGLTVLSFNQIESLDSTEKRILQPDIHRFRNAFARIEIGIYRFDLWMAASFLMISLAVFLPLFFIRAVELLPLSITIFKWSFVQVYKLDLNINLFTVYGIAFIVAFVMLEMLRFLLRRSPLNYFYQNIVLLVLGGGGFYILQIMITDRSLSNLLSHNLRFAIEGIRITALLVLIFQFQPFSLIMSGIMANFFAKRWMPDAVIAARFVSLLRDVQDPLSWNELGLKPYLISSLEDIASCFEYAIPRQLRSGDWETDTAIKFNMRQIASAIREYKVWIATPKPDTRQHLQPQLAQHFSTFVNGDWDNLPHTEPKPITRRQRLAAVLGVLRTFGFALIPLIIIWLVRQSPELRASAGDILDIALIFALLWSVVSLSSVFNPTHLDTTDRIKGIREILPF